MPNSLSAKKRVRQNATRRERNRARKSVLKSDVRKLGDAIHDKKADEARQLLRIVAKRIDQNAAKGTIHRNTAARRKSRLAKRVNKLAAT